MGGEAAYPNEAWMENIHKDGAQFTLLAWIGGTLAGSSNRRFSGTEGANNSNTGFRWGYSSAERMTFAATNGSGTAASDLAASAGDMAMVDGVWQMAALSIDEPAGSNNVLWRRNEFTETASTTYSSPSAGAATWPMNVGGTGNGAQVMGAGSQMAVFLAWEGVALTQNQMGAIFQSMRGRFGI